ncbi:hypothetical protein KJ564_02905, partial [bacterium]|nr:hypothetical protein [bacterium]
MMLAVLTITLALSPLLDLLPDEIPFIVYEWPYNIHLAPSAEAGRYHLTASQLSEHFSIDVYPADTDKDYYLIALDMQWSVHAVEEFPDQTKVLGNIARLLNDRTVNLAGGHPLTGNHVHIEETGSDIVGDKEVFFYIYHKDFEGTVPDTILHFIKTEWLIDTIDDSFVEEPYEYRHLQMIGYEEGAKVDCYTVDGSHFQKEVLFDASQDLYIPFAPGEMGPAMLILRESNTQPQTDYTQAITLHEGWNLVSWHLNLHQPFGVYIWFNELLPDDEEHEWFFGTEPDQPFGQLNTYTLAGVNDYYPSPGLLSPTTEWHLNNAYYFDMETPHTWNDFTNCPLYEPDPPDFNFT